MELCFVHVAGSMSALCNTSHEALYMYVVALIWDLWSNVWLSHGNISISKGLTKFVVCLHCW